MMSVVQTQSEEVIFQMLLPSLEAEGFRVLVHPPLSVLPPFMQGYRPDAIAIKADKKIAFEVKSRRENVNPQVQMLQQMFSAHPDWELRIVYAPTQSVEEAISVIPHELLLENVDRLLKLFDDAGAVPALLTGWSVFEAAARSLTPDNLGRPQTPERLLEILAADGYVTPAEADTLRQLGQLRNAAAHGRLDVAVTRDGFAKLVSITRALLDPDLRDDNQPA